MTGKFIVLEGLDGSGKSMQYQLLRDYLQAQNYKFACADFPDYEGSYHGRLVGKYLRGEFGDVNEVNPYFSSWLYAGDRLEAKDKLKNFLAEHQILLSNRYVGSNLAYHSVKLPIEQRAGFVEWLESLEYKTNAIPKEDIVIYFHLPVAIAQRMVDRKATRSYIAERRDIHERNALYLQEVNEAYLNLCQTKAHWVALDVSDAVTGEMLPPNVIQERVLEILKQERVVKNI